MYCVVYTSPVRRRGSARLAPARQLLYVCMIVHTHAHTFVLVYRMDKKGGGNGVIYPNIMICVDGFEEVHIHKRI